jgi:hypothetical protein
MTEFFFHTDVINQAPFRSRLESYQDIYIASWGEIFAQRRSKYSQFGYIPSLTKLMNFSFREQERVLFHANTCLEKLGFLSRTGC